MASDASLLFYTQEEIDAIHLKERLLMKAQSFWYNFTEDLLVLKEQIVDWASRKGAK